MAITTRVPDETVPQRVPAIARRPSAPARPSVSSWRTALASSVVYTLLWAGLCNSLLDHSTWRALPGASWYAGMANDGAPIAILVVWLVVLLVLAVTGRLWLTLALTLDITLVLAQVNTTKLETRDEPLYPAATGFLASPGFLLDMVPRSTLVLGLGGLALLTVLLLLIGRFAARRFAPVARGASHGAKVRLIALRVVVVLACAASLGAARNFNEPENAWRSLFNANHIMWRPWSQQENYEANGFIAGLLFNMHTDAMKRPDGYSHARMQQIVTTYANSAKNVNASRRAGALDDVNVVLVLSESFSDPMRLRGLSFASNPIPRTRSIMSRTTSGSMLSPGYGGGTANVEFEVLTGLSMGLFAPQVTSPYPQLLADEDDFPSAVSWFASHGHDPIAIHPFTTEMYKRREVYQRLGFQDFIHDSTMKESERIQRGRYIDDTSAFDEVLSQMQTREKPLLVNLVTMQNHMPFTDQYDDPIRVSGLPKGRAEQAGQYARGISITDGSLATFLVACCR